jgi:hypothetical protein
MRTRLTRKCDACGYNYEEVYLVYPKKGYSPKQYCYACAASQGLLNPRRRPRPIRIGKQREKRNLANLPLKAKNAIELVEILNTSEKLGRTLDGLIDIMILNYIILRLPSGEKTTSYEHDENKITYNLTPQSEFEAYTILGNSLGRQHAGHVMWAGGSFKTAKAKAYQQYARIARYIKKRSKILSSMLSQLEGLRKRAIEKKLPIVNIRRAYDSAKLILEIFAAVHRELSANKIKPIFAYYLYKTGIIQMKISEDRSSLFPGMNRKTFMAWGKRCERLERAEANLKRQHLI